jgi:hypothetical protein
MDQSPDHSSDFAGGVGWVKCEVGRDHASDYNKGPACRSTLLARRRG